MNSNPEEVLKLAKKYYKKEIQYSDRKNKKYKIENDEGKFIHFGDKRYEDFTKHKDEKRRSSYLARASKIKGDWINDKYSPNMLSIILLWNGYEYLNNV